MRICVVGAGAMGGFMGAMLAAAGDDVSLVTLGDQLTAYQRNGVRLLMADGSERVISQVRATDDARRLGRHDTVILAVKAHQIEAVAPSLPFLFGPDTTVVTIQNGIPWWYFYRHVGPFDGHRIVCLDPNGVLTTHIPAERIIGCVAYPAAEVVAPGVIRHVEGVRFPVGELDGSASDRVTRISARFIAAGFKSPVLADVRSEIWLKAIGSLAFNPISALTRATLVDICRFPETRELATHMMHEAEQIATKLGVTLRLPIERRIAGAEQVGAHKTSMLQDVEAGQPLEIEALVHAVLELGRLTETPTPFTQAVYACVKLLDRTISRAASLEREEVRSTPAHRVA
jgi:2-dehydropantoate 2-reductase